MSIYQEPYKLLAPTTVLGFPRFFARSGTETKVGQFGYGKRTHRGQMLADLMEKEGLFVSRRIQLGWAVGKLREVFVQSSSKPGDQGI